MQVACEVRRVLAKNPNGIQVRDFVLPFISVLEGANHKETPGGKGPQLPGYHVPQPPTLLDDWRGADEDEVDADDPLPGDVPERRPSVSSQESHGLGTEEERRRHYETAMSKLAWSERLKGFKVKKTPPPQ